MVNMDKMDGRISILSVWYSTQLKRQPYYVYLSSIVTLTPLLSLVLISAPLPTRRFTVSSSPSLTAL